ncbi:hypothetical protein [Brevibacterium litoralis]|uniref:hypothetical protein n=1 Tax=Brevibacterium litoralis TaxID=3138935 RepID=UPI0032EB4D8A
MDALLVVNTEADRPAAAQVTEVLGDIVSRARMTGGVLIFLSAPVPDAGPEDTTTSVYEVGEDELGIASAEADAFDGIDDLAPGLHDLGVDRIVLGGVDAIPQGGAPGGRGAVYQTAMAGLALNFDVIVLGDATVTEMGPPVQWGDEAEAEGVMVRPTRDVWLRM